MAETTSPLVPFPPPDIKPAALKTTTLQNEEAKDDQSALLVPYWVVFRRHYRLSADDKTPRRQEGPIWNHKCERCGKTFKKRWQLFAHAKIHALEPKPPSSKPIRRKKSNHLKLVVDEKAAEYRCVCGESFPSKWLLSAHTKTHTGEKVKPHGCDICKKFFRTSTRLSAHKRTHAGDRPYTCDICDNSYTYASSLKTHKKTHRNGCGDKKVRIRRRRIAGHTCEICNKTFRGPSVLVQHMNVHTCENPYQCDGCDKSYCFLSSLFQHKRLAHGSNNTRPKDSDEETDAATDRPYRCDACSLKFKCRRSLQKHAADSHDLSLVVGKKYACEVCGKVFRRKNRLIKHVRLEHVGERLHVCEICDKSFSQKCHLVNHRLTHTGEKPFVCDVCGRAFAVTSSLVRHARVHTGEKPHACDVCGKFFATKNNADRHRLTMHAK